MHPLITRTTPRDYPKLLLLHRLLKLTSLLALLGKDNYIASCIRAELSMRKITFIACYGDEDRVVDIEEVSGALGAIHIFVDRLYEGSVRLVDGKRVVNWRLPTEKSVHQELMTKDDSDVIIDKMIEAGWIEENQLD